MTPDNAESNKENVQRYTARPFPAYTYIPGERPHPISSPEGHSYGEPAVDLDVRDTELLRAEFAWGVDLFNHAYYWEAHEAWEGVWNAFGRKGNNADFLKGLIKLAAAGVKLLEKKPIGIQRHTSRSIELLAAIEPADLHSTIQIANRLHTLVREIECVDLEEDQQSLGIVLAIADKSQCS